MAKTQYQLADPTGYVFTQQNGLRCDAGDEPVVVVVDLSGYTLDDILKRVVIHEQEFHGVRH